MASYCTFRTSDALVRHLRQYQFVRRSRAYKAMLAGIKADVDEGYLQGVLDGTDGAGRALPALKAERKGAYAGATGKPLTPFGKGSRFYSAYRSQVVEHAGADVILGYLTDDGKTRDSRGRFASRRLRNFFRGLRGRARATPFPEVAYYQITGAGHNPRRDPSGIRPKTWAKIRRRLQGFKTSLMRRGA